jgi:N-acetylglucosamine-6-phosphate deacetylase
MLTTLSARRLVTDRDEIDYPVISIEDGKILRMEEGTPNGSTETLTASFFDIHVHGALAHDFMAASPAEIMEVGGFLARRGVAHYLPTTVTASINLTLRALDHLADAIEVTGEGEAQGAVAVPVGIHLEGPFVSHAKRGCHPEASICEPSVELFDRFQQAARGHIRLLTLAPELPQALELIEHVTASGVRVSIGHSMATEEETVAAINAGLDRQDVYAELICDGVHVHPAFVRIWLKIKGEERAILVTDGMSATGMPDGSYMLGDLTVEVKNGICQLGETLAGSVLTMDKAVANVRWFTGTSLATAVRLASRNPARMVGMPYLTEMAPGTPANFNVFNETGERTGSIFHGRLIT